MPIISHEELPRREGSAPGLEIRVLVDAGQGSNSLRIGELTIAPDSRVPRHIHPNTEEAMVLLEGTLDVLLGERRAAIGPGQTVLAPPGVVHGFVNRSPEPARLLFIFPTQHVEEVLASMPGATVGFPSEKGLTAYRSSDDRPLDRG